MGCLFAFVLLLASCGGSQRFQTVGGGQFDVATTITGFAASRRQFDKAAKAALAVIESDGKLFDIYNDYAGVPNLKTVNDSAGASPVAVDPAILDLLEFSLQAYDFTGGAVNIAMGPVLRLWHDAREAATASPEAAFLPSREALEAAAGLTDITGLVIDRQAGTVFLAEKGMSLDVGAMAKGFTARRAMEAAKAAGVTDLIIDMGGNVVVSGQPMDGRDRWSVGIQNPRPGNGSTILDTIYLNDMAVVSSGNYQRFFVVDGRSYNHIIDPNTLAPAENFDHVTVLHPDSGVADALSTALFILPVEQGRALAYRQGAEALWVGHDGAIEATDGFAAISANLGGAAVTD